jgi:hypothetical protein
LAGAPQTGAQARALEVSQLRAAATQVHHLTYVGVFNESPDDLVALCDSCHAELHHKTPANDNQLTMFPLFGKDKGAF